MVGARALAVRARAAPLVACPHLALVLLLGRLQRLIQLKLLAPLLQQPGGGGDVRQDQLGWRHPASRAKAG